MKRMMGTAVIVASLGLVAVGCGGPERGEVEGVVRRNGGPVADVVVTFVPEPGQTANGSRASGQTDPEGRFHLRGDDQKDSVIVGTYRVVIEDLAVYSVPRSPDGTLLHPPTVRFPAVYGDPLQTPLRKQIQPGRQTVTIDLDGPP